MENERLNEQKQDADEDRSPEQVQRDGFTAQEIGEASSYDGTSEAAQQMRRGDATNGDGAERDAGGASNEAKR
jgi:hypothetical protein